MMKLIRLVRQVALAASLALLRLFGRRGPAGWQRSTRPVSLRGR